MIAEDQPVMVKKFLQQVAKDKPRAHDALEWIAKRTKKTKARAAAAPPSENVWRGPQSASTLPTQQYKGRDFKEIPAEWVVAEGPQRRLFCCGCEKRFGDRRWIYRHDCAAERSEAKLL